MYEIHTVHSLLHVSRPLLSRLPVKEPGLRTEELVCSESYRIHGFLSQKDIIFFLFLLYLSRFKILLQKHASVVGTRLTRASGMTNAYSLTRVACDGLHLVFLHPGWGWEGLGHTNNAPSVDAPAVSDFWALAWESVVLWPFGHL